MTTTNHNITASTMLELLPFATGTVTPTSAGLTTGNLEDWISEAAGQLNALLQRHGMDPESLSDDVVPLVQSGIRAYVTAKALSHRRFPADEVSRAWETWQSVRKTLREDPESLGDDQLAARQVHTNVNTSCPTRTRFDSGRKLF